MANPVYKSLVDWNNDGDFDDTGENVSSRVRVSPLINIARGRDQIRTLAQPLAGSTAFLLDNQSQDYSPENGASPLTGLLIPGRAVEIRGSKYLDTFDRADDAVSLGGLDIGNVAWTADVGTWGISGNLGYSVSDAQGDLATIETSLADIVAECVVRGDIDTLSPRRCPGLVVRLLDTSNYLFAFQLIDSINLYKADGGILTVLSTVAVSPFIDSQDYTLRIECIGNSVKVYVDETLYISHTLTGGNTKYNAYTKHGITIATKSGLPSAAARFNNFRLYVWLSHCYLDSIEQHPEPGSKSAEIRSLGILAKLRGQKISTALYGDGTSGGGITTNTALGYLLDAVGLTDAALRVFDTGKTTMLWWWLDNEDAFDAMVALLNTEGPGAAIYEDGRGRIHFESRHYRLLTSRCTTSQATIRDTGSEPLFSGPLRYDPGLKDIINVCSIDVKRRSAKSSAAFWSLGSTLTLVANESRSYTVKDSGGNPFTAAVSPLAAGTDYTVTAGSVSSATLNRTSGGNAVLTVVAGASGVTLTGLQVRGQLVSVDAATLLTNSISTATSQAKYGVRTFRYAIRAEISVGDAQDFADAIVSRYQNPRPIVTFMLNRSHVARFQQIMEREISDRITVVDAQTVLNADFIVERIEHSIAGNGQNHVVQIGCEKSSADQFWILGDANLSILGSSTILGY